MLTRSRPHSLGYPHHRDVLLRGKNFVPGTTAEDIAGVMRNVGGTLEYCRLVAATPNVTIDMAFYNKAGAEQVVSMFNGKIVIHPQTLWLREVLTKCRLMDGCCTSIP